MDAILPRQACQILILILRNSELQGETCNS